MIARSIGVSFFIGAHYTPKFDFSQQLQYNFTSHLRIRRLKVVDLKAKVPHISIRKNDHEHRHLTTEWDESLGPQVVEKTSTHATYKFLHACPCGDKIVEKVRTLIH